MAKEEIIFPNNIRNIRMAAGMKMTELANRAKLSLSAISKIEKGVRRLNQRQLLNICNLLGCKLSDIFIKESDKVAGDWQNEIKRRMTDNEGSGLKIFGSGLRKIRQKSGKTIAQAAKDARLTLSVYHKMEMGQREVYPDEIDQLTKSFGYDSEGFFDEVAKLYKSGELNKQITKVKERVKSILVPDKPLPGIDMPDSMLGAKLYNNARKKLVPIFGSVNGKSISFRKSDKKMIMAPIGLEGRKSIYAVVPNPRRMGGVIPETSYVFADSDKKPDVGDMAVFIDAKFDTMGAEDTANAQIAIVQKDSKGKLFGQITSPDEKVSFDTMHKVVMIVME